MSTEIRSQFSFGTSGMTNLVSGGGHMALRTGPLPTMAS